MIGSVTVIGRLKDVVTRKCEANSSPEIEESCCSTRRRRLDMPPDGRTCEQSVCR